MGASMSSGPFPPPPPHVCRCDATDKPSTPATSPESNIAPPQMHRPQSFEEKLWDKVLYSTYNCSRGSVSCHSYLNARYWSTQRHTTEPYPYSAVLYLYFLSFDLSFPWNLPRWIMCTNNVTPPNIKPKFRSQPLVPIGCAATAYFLASGIKSFQRQDPRRGQKMMRARVAAQFATLGVFMWYIGFDRINFGIT